MMQVNKLNEKEHIKSQALRILCWIQFQESFPSLIIETIKFQSETHFQINKHPIPLQILKTNFKNKTKWTLTGGV
jgi:hypothetical protein